MYVFCPNSVGTLYRLCVIPVQCSNRRGAVSRSQAVSIRFRFQTEDSLHSIYIVMKGVSVFDQHVRLLASLEYDLVFFCMSACTIKVETIQIVV